MGNCLTQQHSPSRPVRPVRRPRSSRPPQRPLTFRQRLDRHKNERRTRHRVWRGIMHRTHSLYTRMRLRHRARVGVLDPTSGCHDAAGRSIPTVSDEETDSTESTDSQDKAGTSTEPPSDVQESDSKEEEEVIFRTVSSTHLFGLNTTVSSLIAMFDHDDSDEDEYRESSAGDEHVHRDTETLRVEQEEPCRDEPENSGLDKETKEEIKPENVSEIKTCDSLLLGSTVSSLILMFESDEGEDEIAPEHKESCHETESDDKSLSSINYDLPIPHKLRPLPREIKKAARKLNKYPTGAAYDKPKLEPIVKKDFSKTADKRKADKRSRKRDKSRNSSDQDCIATNNGISRANDKEQKLIPIGPQPTFNGAQSSSEESLSKTKEHKRRKHIQGSNAEHIANKEEFRDIEILLDSLLKVTPSNTCSDITKDDDIVERKGHDDKDTGRNVEDIKRKHSSKSIKDVKSYRGTSKKGGSIRENKDILGCGPSTSGEKRHTANTTKKFKTKKIAKDHYQIDLSSQVAQDGVTENVDKGSEPLNYTLKSNLRIANNDKATKKGEDLKRHSGGGLSNSKSSPRSRICDFNTINRPTEISEVNKTTNDERTPEHVIVQSSETNNTSVILRKEPSINRLQSKSTQCSENFECVKCAKTKSILCPRCKAVCNSISVKVAESVKSILAPNEIENNSMNSLGNESINFINVREQNIIKDKGVFANGRVDSSFYKEENHSIEKDNDDDKGKDINQDREPIIEMEENIVCVEEEQNFDIEKEHVGIDREQDNIQVIEHEDRETIVHDDRQTIESDIESVANEADREIPVSEFDNMVKESVKHMKELIQKGIQESQRRVTIELYVRSPDGGQPRKIYIKVKLSKIKGVEERLKQSLSVNKEPERHEALDMSTNYKGHVGKTSKLIDIKDRKIPRWFQTEGAAKSVIVIGETMKFIKLKKPAPNSREKMSMEKLVENNIIVQCKPIERIKIDEHEFPGILSGRMLRGFRKERDRLLKRMN